MISVGFNTPIDIIPTPDFDVPYTAPKFMNTNADPIPIYSKNQDDVSDGGDMF